jgi:hypothetical protein
MIRFVLQGTDLFETLQRGHSALHDCGHDQVGLEEGQFLESRDGGRDGFHILHKSADETGTSHPAHFVEHGSQLQWSKGEHELPLDFRCQAPIDRRLARGLFFRLPALYKVAREVGQERGEKGGPVSRVAGVEELSNVNGGFRDIRFRPTVSQLVRSLDR